MALPWMLQKRWQANVVSGTTDGGDGTNTRNDNQAIQCEHLRQADSDAEDSEKTSGVSSIMCSLSDMNLSGSSDGFQNPKSSEETDVSKCGNSPPSPVDLSQQFLPPVRSRPQCVQSFICSRTESDLEGGDFMSSFSFNTTAPTEYYKSLIQEFDLCSMREKLAAQKEFLFDSFGKQPTLPQAFSWKSDHKTKQLGGQKLKVRLQKLSRAARHFFSTKIFRHQPSSIQRCELQLIGFDDRVERLVLVISRHHDSRHEEEVMHVSLPSFFETNRVLVPRTLLPVKQGQRIRVMGYGIAGQDEADSSFAGLREIVLSGVCTIQSDSRPLMSGMLVLQPHRPSRSLTGLERGVQSGGTRIKMTCSDTGDIYTFSTSPSPVAMDFTELCVLQMADPFREYLALSASSCDHTAAFQVTLTPGQYHSVCCYRMRDTSMKELFSVDSATPAANFRAYLDKALITEHMKQAAQQATQGAAKPPVLCPSLLLVRPPGLDMEGLMRILGTGHADRLNTSTVSNASTVTKASTSKLSSADIEQGLYFCTWNVDTDAEDTDTTKSWYPLTAGWTAAQNPRLPPGSREYTHLPSLSVFNLSMQLYFANHWTFYDKHYVTVVVCTKGSPCHQVCRRRLQKLDPYSNPFLFRRRFLDPEPSVAVYASASIHVEVIYSDSPAILQLVFACSENVYFSKVHADDSENS